jgi:hypothetical protein
VAVAPAGADTTVALVLPREGDRVGVEVGIGLASKDVDADNERLREQGVDVDDVMRMGDPVPPMFFFRDQDANTLLIVAEN